MEVEVEALVESSWREISWAREAIDVRGIRWERRACWAETRLSHSMAMAVARCGFVAGMLRGDLVVGLRTSLVSR